MADATSSYSNPLTALFKRNCIECNTSETLVCPSCPSGSVCIQTSQTCSQCPYRKCVPQAQSSAPQNTSAPSSGPNVGAIAGGVIAGFIFVGIATWLFWRFVLKKRRQQWEQEYEAEALEKTTSEYAPSVGGQTARTRTSVASTAFTRASNVIQIAFIPGVTDRADGAGYTPPVPPIPSSQRNSPLADGGDHYFMPSDLRGSTYSGFTDDGASFTSRRSLGRSIAPSIAPSLLRQSVASTIYTADAIQHPMPAQHIVRARANVVSVHAPAGKAPGSSGSSTPAVPPLDRTRFPVVPTRPQGEEGGHSISLTADDASEVAVSKSPVQVKEAIQEATRKASSNKLGPQSESQPGVLSPFSDAHRLSDSDGETTP